MRTQVTHSKKMSGKKCLHLIIRTTPSLKSLAFARFPTRVGEREEGMVTTRTGAVWWDTPEDNEASSLALLKRRECLSSGDRSLSPCLHAGVLAGPGVEWGGILSLHRAAGNICPCWDACVTTVRLRMAVLPCHSNATALGKMSRWRSRHPSLP